MDPTNFVIKTFTNNGKVVLSDVKAYANSASDEIDRMRANSVESRTEIDY